MMKTMIIKKGQKPTNEQLKEVEEAKKSPIIFDEDCEELSIDMINAFKNRGTRCNRKIEA